MICDYLLCPPEQQSLQNLPPVISALALNFSLYCILWHKEKYEETSQTLSRHFKDTG